MDVNYTLTRKLDDLGRVVIPQEIRTRLGWKENTAVEIAAQDNGLIIIREAALRCSLCLNQAESLQRVELGFVCPECAGKITV